jgi:hypothetical protein
MPLLSKNKEAFGSPKSNLKKQPLPNVYREDIFYREDIKMTFVYALIGISALAILGAFGYMGVQQLRK